MLVFRSPCLALAAFLTAVAYGITFPLIAIRLEATGVNGMLIGLNAAMPPLGWIIGSMLVPFLQIRVGLPFKRLLQFFLVIAIVALLSLRFAESYIAMTALRLAFGGAMGSLFRCVEYWINDVSTDNERGRNLSGFGILFFIAIVLGSVVQPEFGTADWIAFGPPLLLAIVGLILLHAWKGQPEPIVDVTIPPAAATIVRSIPVALLAVLVYGIFEAAPTTMLQVYAIRNNLESATAAYALSAAALGNIVAQYPVAALSDRIGRQVPLLACSISATAVSAAIPWTLDQPGLFLAAVALLGAAAGSTYSMGLAMIGDVFKGAHLVVANAAFGIVYAAGNISGPLIDGFAIDQLKTHGLMLSLAVTFFLLAVTTASGLLRPSGQR